MVHLSYLCLWESTVNLARCISVFGVFCCVFLVKVQKLILVSTILRVYVACGQKARQSRVVLTFFPFLAWGKISMSMMKINFLLWERLSTVRGCPEKLQTLHLRRYSETVWTWSWTTCCRWPCLSRVVGSDALQRSLKVYTSLWFHEILLRCTKCQSKA